MIQQTFVSDPIQYAGLCGENNGAYNEYLCIPPRTFSDGDFSFQGGSILTVPKKMADTDFVIWVLGVVSTTHWPSYNFLGFELNGRTGAFIRNIDPYGDSAVTTMGGFKQDRNGAVWGSVSSWTGGGLYLLDIDVPNGRFLLTSTMIDMDLFEGGIGVPYSPDMSTGVLLTKNSLTPTGYLTVLSLATGAVLRHLPCGGTPQAINWETGNRAYIICTNGLVVLMDIVTGEIFSVTHHTLPTTDWESIYDFRLKRLLICPVTPDAADGSSTVRVYGYRPIPVAAKLTKPIPLSRAIEGETLHAITRLVGATGEPVSGAIIHGELDNANGTLQSNVAATGITGYAKFAINCITAGNVTLDADTEV